MNFNDIVKQSVLDNFTTDMTGERIIIVLVASLILGIYIFYVYRIAVNNEFYSKDFNKVLTLMSVVTATIVLAIQSNLIISLGMVGALSIVRFRTAIKNPIDLFFLYWSISIGIVCGAGLYLLAVIACVVITIAMFAINHIESPSSLGLLVINSNSSEICEKAVSIVEKHSEFCRIKNKTIKRENVEVVIELKSKKEMEIEKILGDTDGIKSFAFINFDRENRI